MILQDAFAAAQSFLDEVIRPDHDLEIVIVTCRETEEDWRFDFNTRQLIEHGDVSGSLLGIGPVIVAKSGEPPFCGTVFD